MDEICASSNQLMVWLRQMEGLRKRLLFEVELSNCGTEHAMAAAVASRSADRVGGEAVCLM